MERNASCCRVLIRASFIKFKFNPSSDFLLATTSSISAAGNKKQSLLTANCVTAEEKTTNSRQFSLECPNQAFFALVCFPSFSDWHRKLTGHHLNQSESKKVRTALFWFTSICDCSSKLTLPSQPIQIEKHYLATRVFPRFRRQSRFYVVFSLALCDIPFVLIGRGDCEF